MFAAREVAKIRLISVFVNSQNLGVQWTLTFFAVDHPDLMLCAVDDVLWDALP